MTAFPVWLRACVGLAIVLGIFFRFYHIDRKVYWDDEIFTSLHVLGLTEADVVARSPALTSAAALRTVLHPGPHQPNTVADTVRALVIEDPHHSPLYYIAAYAWVKLFGDSIATIRMLSAILGVLALPCMYWLCMELFATPAAAWMGTALLALAPVSVLYSQEAREYALWTIAIVLMGATFLRAARLMSAGSWALYAAAVTFGLYVFPFSAFVAVGNLAVLGSRKTFPTNRGRLYPIAATSAALVLFLPWLVIVARGLQVIDRSMNTTLAHKNSVAGVLRLFLGLFRLDFIDLNLLHRATINLLILVPVLAFVAYAVSVVCRSDDGRLKLFVLAMMIFAAAPFVLPDLLISGNRTSNPRYFTPLYIALDLSLVYLFQTKLLAAGPRPARRLLWPAVFGGLLVARLVSCGLSSQAHTWWTKYNERSIDIAQVVNTSTHPILITDNLIEFALSLSNYLNDRVALDLAPRCYMCSFGDRGPMNIAALRRGDGRSAVFLLGPSVRLQGEVQTAMRASRTEQNYHCIDVRSNCASTLHLW